ncbi:hypothetical protein H5410_007423 [Solanum commersonii]|uniref:Uncharacterized protein n=1 Tax=Solanum commersonii TaxID=4109 RepID=A0A9J6AC28_SOLCO|nr:hypothetical protein H5410_007423 [Solanum commersonii]
MTGKFRGRLTSSKHLNNFLGYKQVKMNFGQGNTKDLFRANAAYKLLTQPNQQLAYWPWKQIWKAKVPHKVATKEAAPTLDNLLWSIILNLKGISWSMPGKISEALSSWEGIGSHAKNGSRWRIVCLAFGGQFGRKATPDVLRAWWMMCRRSS